MSEQKRERARGDREWTQEQRQRQSEFMKNLHAQKRKRQQADQLPEKTGGIEKMTIGTLVRALQSYLELGADDETPVIFKETCLKKQEITGKHSFDPSLGKPVFESIIIR